MAADTDTRLNFADVEDQKEFELLPQGKYHVMLTDLSEKLSESENNPGARILRFEFTVQSGKYENRKVWDNQVCTPKSMWKVKALLVACEVPTDDLSYDFDSNEFMQGDETLDIEDLVGTELDVKVGVRQARYDNKTERQYDAQNRVTAFYVHEQSDADLIA